MSIDERPTVWDGIAETVDGFAAADRTRPRAPADRPAPEPVEAKHRVASVDLIRGVALLGILAMNIVSFAWPEGVYSVPIRDPDAGSLDVALWAFNHAVFPHEDDVPLLDALRRGARPDVRPGRGARQPGSSGSTTGACPGCSSSAWSTRT